MDQSVTRVEVVEIKDGFALQLVFEEAQSGAKG
jgi:hypothetical protein